jgi:TonB family protein
MKLSMGLVNVAALLAMTTSTSPQDSTQPMCLCKFEAPEYSIIARHANMQGTVRVDVSVDSEGTPQEVTAVESKLPILSEYAVKAVKQWRFCSSTKLASNKIRVTFRFNLRGESADWSPTDVTFDPSGEVDITTAAVKPTRQY